MFTSKDENLTKAHVKFLESSLVAASRNADRYDLENGNTPSESSLPRADRDAMVEFVENIRMVLGTLGYPVLEPLLRASTSSKVVAPATQQPAVRLKAAVDLTFRVGDLTAFGAATDEGFVVKKGSKVSRLNTESAALKIVKFKEQLQADGRLTAEGDHLLLTEDVLVSSSSYAAVLVAGTSRSGPQGWIAADGRSLKAIEDDAVRSNFKAL